MNTAMNHYEFLGVPEDASDNEIERAISRFEDPAYALAYADPGRNDGLIEVVDRMRTDLLSGPVRRRAYDRSVHPGTSMVIDGLDVAELPGEPWQVPPDKVEDGIPPSAPARMRGLLAGVALALLLVAAVTTGAQRSNLFSQSPAPTVSLYVSGVRGNHEITSGSVVRLRWTQTPGVLAYRIQVASIRAGLPPQMLQSVLTTQNFYTLRVIGQRTYAWRMRAGKNGNWGAYTSWHAFPVAVPIIHAPTGLQAVVRSHGARRIAHVCWSAVSGARAYTLRVDGGRNVTVHATCATQSVHPGSYVWTVAAQVQAARLYTGPVSQTNRFVVVRPTHRRHTTHRTTAVSSTTRRRTTSAPSTAPQPILVAIAAPPPVAPVAARSPAHHHARSHARATRRGHVRRSALSTQRAVRHITRRRVSSPAGSVVRPAPTAVRVPVRRVVFPAGVPVSGATHKHTGSVTIPPPPPPPPIPTATRILSTIPPPPPPPPIP